MKRFVLVLVITAIGVAIGWFAATQFRHSHAANKAANGETIYTCSMHPQVRAKKPGKCPFCGMDLVPLSQAGTTTLQNAVMLSSNRINVINVQTAQVRRQPLVRTLRVAGTIDDNDATHRLISAYVDGRIDKLFVNFVGAEIRKGQPLASFFSPMLLSAEREYIALATQKLGTNAVEDLKSDRERLLAGAAHRLKQMGLSEEQIASLKNKPLEEIRTEIHAPVSGTVVNRFVYEGQYVKEGEKLFEIADFSTMWFKVDAYETDLAWLRPGQPVEVTTPAAPGKTFKAPITFIDPNINDPTRTAKVRVEIPNPIVATNANGPRRELFHRVFAEGVVKTETPDVLAVPRTAVLATGRRTLVYVDKGEGVYEQRPIVLGRVGDDLWEVLDGLKEGERIVTTGNLLLDAQAQLEQGGSSIPADVGKPMPELQETQQQAVQVFLTAADAVSGALSSDDLAAYNSSVGKLKPAIQNLTLAFSNAPAWKPLVEKVGAAAPGGAAIDLKGARSQFLPFTITAVEFAQTVRKQEPFKSVKIYKCPMAPKAGQTSFWLQRQGPLRNPFYGSEMLDCGSEVMP
jgi:membrane fusion protein, copper/silver efflux system